MSYSSNLYSSIVLCFWIINIVCCLHVPCKTMGVTCSHTLFMQYHLIKIVNITFASICPVRHKV